MTPTANLASTETDADHPAAPAAEAGPFVLNLCSSTTPMALAQTDLPELKRFTFFVSRRFEEGRERFRLHMGFFASQAEAEEWLGVVRDIYPGAWAGEAPGKKLRARAAEAAAAQARHAAGPQPVVAAPAPPRAIPPAPPATRPKNAQPALPSNVPTLIPTLQPPAPAPAAKPKSVAATPVAVVAHPAQAAPAAAPKRPTSAPVAPQAAARPQPQARPMPAARPVTAAPRPPQARAAAPVAQIAAASAGPQRPAAKAPVGKPAAPSPVPPSTHPRLGAVLNAARAPVQAASRSPQQPAKKPIFADSNVKEVLAALDSPADGTGETRLMPAPVARGDAADDSSLTDTQVLRFLETRREEAPRPQPALQADSAAESGISLLKPDDTGTRRALKEAVSHNDPVSFAVQLQWSVQPVVLDKVPPLAIFSAYTLYSVEGSREGRKWYGLRLGFFNDAISAKQVAYYVRSEFNSVAVVPVSPQERERATEDNQRFAGVGAPRKRRASEDNEFKLIDSDDEAPRAAPAAAAAAPAGATAASSASAAPIAPAASAPAAAQRAAATRNPRKAAGKAGGKVGASERRTPQTLEETLEILGANDLAIDNGSGESLSDTGVRHLRVEIQKNTPFSRLLERLSERVKKT
ncbi:MAG TPA: hypothetical protein VN735_01775 [Steroidobacteraceae bacterium]|nr:hypothetical protein [Steroidobacteraceae bacterium]